MIAARLSSVVHELQQLPITQSSATLIGRILDKRNVVLPPAIAADRHEIVTSDAGTISYYADLKASGRPLVLVHGLHAAASSYEMGPLFEAFRGKRKVYALDLPGFGFSERSSRAYTPRMYVSAIEHLLRHVAIREPADVIALSLSSEYAARVAIEMPELVRSLVLISPTGFAVEKKGGAFSLLLRRTAARLQGQTETMTGRLAYELLVSKPSLRWFLRRSLKRLDRSLLNYSYATSHQPGAFRAPLAFVAGALFPAGDARKKTYRHVRAPTLVLYDRDGYTSFGELDAFVRAHEGYRARRVSPTRGLPQFDAREQTLEVVGSFYGELKAAHYNGSVGAGFGNGKALPS